MPKSLGNGWDPDGRDKKWMGETQYIHHLIPYIDSHFCTLADRAHRAIAGRSAGGYSAAYLAARNPDLFVAAGSFSGLPLDLFDPSPGFWYGAVKAPVGGPSGEPWGEPAKDEVWFHSGNPTDLASNLGGVSLYVAAGNGQPCDEEDAELLASSPEGAAFGSLETTAHRQANSSTRLSQTPRWRTRPTSPRAASTTPNCGTATCTPSGRR
jgi:S-formylglutathione hydrolase FrmB